MYYLPCMRGEVRYAYTILVGKPIGRDHLEDLRHSREKNIKMNFKET
jgi:hypothetical protein